MTRSLSPKMADYTTGRVIPSTKFSIIDGVIVDRKNHSITSSFTKQIDHLDGLEDVVERYEQWEEINNNCTKGPLVIDYYCPGVLAAGVPTVDRKVCEENGVRFVVKRGKNTKTYSLFPLRLKNGKRFYLNYQSPRSTGRDRRPYLYDANDTQPVSYEAPNALETVYHVLISVFKNLVFENDRNNYKVEIFDIVVRAVSCYRKKQGRVQLSSAYRGDLRMETVMGCHHDSTIVRYSSNLFSALTSGFVRINWNLSDVSAHDGKRQKKYVLSQSKKAKKAEFNIRGSNIGR